MIPDPEDIVGDYLRSALSALVVPVVGKTPGDTGEPWVRLTLINAPSPDGKDHLVEAYLQLDCYAGGDGGQEEANLVARTAREALRTIKDASHGSVVVTGCRIDGHTRMPDTDYEPARDRVILTTTVWMHG